MTDDRDFRPAARYAANDQPGIRWCDERTGQEQFSRPVGVDTLLDRGASIQEPDAVKLPHRAKIGPNMRTGGWSASLARTQLDPHERDGAVDFLGTKQYVRTRAFDDREEAVEWISGEFNAFASADVRDAAEWYEERKAEREEKEAIEA